MLLYTTKYGKFLSPIILKQHCKVIKNRRMMGIVPVDTSGWNVYVIIDFCRNYVMDKQTTHYCRVNLYS